MTILTRHEIVNDKFGDIPVAVTYCPLCNTAASYDRRVGDETIRLGVSGLLRNSDMVMWDTKSTSLWQQITGEGIVGRFTGTRLDSISTAIVSFGEVRESFPEAEVMSFDQGFGTEYRVTPYQGYSRQSAPFPGFADAPEDTPLPALERVIAVDINDAVKAYGFPTMQIADSRSVGTRVAYEATVDGRTLTFSKSGENFTDEQTSSTWSILGTAIAGSLEGTQLTFANHRNEFWFAFAFFFPEAELYGK
ncbi:MAG: hypothetical protein ACI91O_001309 [Candidatus Poriferisodalaceae bacterium]